jgi:hypothetical protein
MKKVFMIAHQFPPMGGSGVQRTSKFVKYLPELGYDPIVFTIDVKEQLIDDSLNKDISENITVIRTKPYAVEAKSGFLGIIGKVLGRYIFIPDFTWAWYRMNRKKALNYVKNHNIDLVYTTSFPYTDHLMGHYIKRKLPHIKWVADFRDEWTQNPYILDKNYNALRRKIEKNMEKKVAYGCDLFIANTPLMLKAFLNDYDIKDKTYVISNGYDEEDFEGLDRTYQKNDKLIITYSGSIYGRTKPDAFFIALKKAIEEGLIDQDKIVVRIIGSYSSSLVNRMRELFPYEKSLVFLPYMPHKKSIEKLIESDILLFIIGVGKGSEKIYTGKIFEYFYANRLMLAMVPENSDPGRIIEETNTGVLCSNEDSEDIYPKLITLYHQWEKGELKHEPNWDEIKKYSRYELTRRLVDVFNRAGNMKG